MKHQIVTRSIVFTVAFLVLANTVTAGLMDYLPSFGGSSSPEILIVVSNHAKPRLLAEVAQVKKGYPILLISPEQGGDQLFYMPKSPDVRLVPHEQLVEFLAVLSPRKVVILGDEKFVPASYVKTIRNRYPLVLIAGEDWVKNAKALGDTVSYPKLVEIYREYLGQMLDDQVKRADDGAAVDMEERILLP